VKKNGSGGDDRPHGGHRARSMQNGMQGQVDPPVTWMMTEASGRSIAASPTCPLPLRVRETSTQCATTGVKVRKRHAGKEEEKERGHERMDMKGWMPRTARGEKKELLATERARDGDRRHEDCLDR
jgi:hypothetical protein